MCYRGKVEGFWRPYGKLFASLVIVLVLLTLALREFVGLWSGWLVVGFMLGGVLGRRSFGGL